MALFVPGQHIGNLYPAPAGGKTVSKTSTKR